ncbi:MAG TPA: D-alanyl-D-alanine endopeptidase [Rhodocyclaceae bacterium]|jgi:D-alanyl-D-alanine endopeptidase (penicillin-binding protein 7)|nr:D-alanyl-D-alanine endopeptidase [Rhodocyclaceae bacterium]
MKKVLIVALAVVSLSCAHAATDTSAPQKPTAATKKPATKKAVAKKTLVKKAPAKKTAARNTAKTVAVVQKPVLRQAQADMSDRIVGREMMPPGIQSSSVIVQDQATGSVLYEKNASAIVPIASISKLMTAMVSLDAQPDMRDVMSISEDDVDRIKGTRSRLTVGTQLTRENMLRLALMSSENRAAYALSRYYPGGRTAFVEAMNRKAQSLGLTDTHFEDPTGLTSANVSSARDLVKMVAAAHQYPLIRQFTTTPEYTVDIGGREQVFHNTNSLVRNENSGWDIGLSKTGYINEAGKCLVMQAWFDQKPMIIVLLDSWGKMTRVADAVRIKKWVEHYALANKANTI